MMLNETERRANLFHPYDTEIVLPHFSIGFGTQHQRSVMSIASTIVTTLNESTSGLIYEQLDGLLGNAPPYLYEETLKIHQLCSVSHTCTETVLPRKSHIYPIQLTLGQLSNFLA